MGTIVKRKKSLIHDNSVGKHTLNGSTYCAFSMVNPESTINILNIDNAHTNSFKSYGCCTSTSQQRFSYKIRPKEGEWVFMKMNFDNLPSLYRDKKYLQRWIDFINETFEFAEVYMIGYNSEDLTNKSYINKNIKFTFEENNVYFAIKKAIKFGTSANYQDLFVLSLVRYLSSFNYQYMVYDTLRLRKLKSLSDLTNWDILNIAKFGAQLNDTDYESKNSNLDNMMLNYYRSPLALNIYVPAQASLEKVIELLSKNNTQNTACSNSKSVKLNVIYLMNLFQKKQYRKLFNLFTDKKYLVNNPDNEYYNVYKTHTVSFENLNTIFNHKQYESTL